MAASDPNPLDVQVALEKTQIENAPKVPLSGNVGICNWCGRVAQNLVPVELIGGVMRYKGECCNGGGRHNGGHSVIGGHHG